MSFFRIVDETGSFMCVPSGQWREWMCCLYIYITLFFFCFFFLLPVSWDSGIGNLLMWFCWFPILFTCFGVRRGYMSSSSIGMVLAVEVGLNDGIDSMSVFIIHPS